MHTRIFFYCCCLLLLLSCRSINSTFFTLLSRSTPFSLFQYTDRRIQAHHTTHISSLRQAISDVYKTLSRCLSNNQLDFHHACMYQMNIYVYIFYYFFFFLLSFIYYYYLNIFPRIFHCARDPWLFFFLRSCFCCSCSALFRVAFSLAPIYPYRARTFILLRMRNNNDDICNIYVQKLI